MLACLSRSAHAVSASPPDTKALPCVAASGCLQLTNWKCKLENAKNHFMYLLPSYFHLCDSNGTPFKLRSVLSVTAPMNSQVQLSVKLVDDDHAEYDSTDIETIFPKSTMGSSSSDACLVLIKLSSAENFKFSNYVQLWAVLGARRKIGVFSVSPSSCVKFAEFTHVGSSTNSSRWRSMPTTSGFR